MNEKAASAPRTWPNQAVAPSPSGILPTVREAYELIAGDIPTIQERILWLVERSPDGLTSLELEPIFRVSAVRRLSELRDQGRVEFRCATCWRSEWSHEGMSHRFQMMTRQGLSGAHRGVYFAGGKAISKQPCPLCQTRVPASRIGAAQLVLV